MTKQLVERKMMTAFMSSPGFSVCSLFECSYFWMIAAMALPPPDPEFVLRGTAAPVHTLHFSCRGQEPEFPILFSGSANGLVQIWNLKTHRVDKTMDGHGGKSVYWVETIHGRDGLLSQGRDQKICLWDLAEGRNVVTDSISVDSVGFCRCSLLKVAQDRWLIAMPANDPDEVQVLELPSKTSVCTLKPEAGAKLGMPMCLKLWQVHKTHELINSGISDVTIRQDRKILATAGWDYRIRIFGWKKVKPLAVLDYHTATVHCVAFSDHSRPSERLLAAGSNDQRISIWSLYNRT
ncbi:guanine nucleotide-binding protein subunit beta-like protein 1 isoform X3 [Alligator mississippiensis]|uniref:guanine nucleotide-binding protein subunit beta-like protein 1 isoform X3 n=1 Tax=Alligator mississippiensis TaxID=8496 RepID=UPI0009076B40|nr:guanine nucleotide-binding protein subunit beta-like protein 1 isoform X3 [Alligator mississippiensis]